MSNNNIEYYNRELKKIDTRLLHSERWILIMIFMALVASLVLLVEIQALQENEESAANGISPHLTANPRLEPGIHTTMEKFK